MATVDELLSKRKFKIINKGTEENADMEKEEIQEQKFFNYRPWNFMEEMDRLDAIKAEETKSISETSQRQNVDNSETTPTQLPHNSHTTPTQSGSKVVAKWQQSGNKAVAETGNKVVTKWEQTGNKLVTENRETGNTTGNKVVTTFSFSSLVGLQKKILLFLYESCKAARSKITNPISLEHLSDSLKSSIGSLKTTIRRLENKQLLTRVEYKNGRGGWSKSVSYTHLTLPTILRV